MRRFPFPLIEPLESRIAPAPIIYTAVFFNPSNKTSPPPINPHTGQPYLQFYAADGASQPGFSALTGANLAIAQAVGENPNVYFITIGAGEDLRIPTDVGYQNLVNVSSGSVVAFFTDTNHDGIVNSNELTGLALATKTSVALGTGVSGDIVTNLNSSGTLGPGLLSNTVTSLTIAGSVTGSFIAGGAVSRFEATGTVGEILTGSAANGYTYSFEAVGTPTGQTLLTVAPPTTHTAGPSLSNVNIAGSTLIQLGAGGPGAAGGSIFSLTLLDDALPLTVQAGPGGAGGAGGFIANVLINGPLPSTTTIPNAPIILAGGVGGAGVGSGKGGAGGAVQNVYVGYNTATANNLSVTTLPDNVTVEGGAGGTGGTGGAGGSLNNINVYTTTPHDTTPGAIEIQVLGGNGGASPLGGRGGSGGLINNVNLDNAALPPTDPITLLPNDTVATSPTNGLALVEAGAGGSASNSGAGGAGGSVGNLTLKGFSYELAGGAGGSGVSSGGAGGGINLVNVVGSSGDLPGDDFHAEFLALLGGAGGNGSDGKGGAGGSVSGLNVLNSDFGSTGFQVAPGANGFQVSSLTTIGFQIAAGAGGIAGKGGGGAGGSLSNVSVTDGDFATDAHRLGNSGTVDLTAGNGGSAPGLSGVGGAGGSMTNVAIIGTRLAVPSISAGNGGSGGINAIAGKGGSGGTISSVSLRSSEGLYTSTVTGSNGLLYDTAANFVTDDVKIGDTVEDTTSGQTATVTAIDSPTEITLDSDIFVTGDSYLVDGFGGVAGSQGTLIDTNVNFIAEGLKVGDAVEDISATAGNLGIPVTAVVTGVSANQLNLSADIVSVGDQYEVFNQTNLTAGSGGTGILTGAGGVGGSIINSSAITAGSVSLIAGSGGSAGTAVGAGGSLRGDGAFSTYASAYLYAGNAGSTGAKAGTGGGISGANVQALDNISLIGGNGALGGAGGSVTSSGFSGVLLDGSGFNPPAGNITVQAGSGGSSPTGSGGAGGSITNLTGFISSGDTVDPFTTQFVAGAGGSGLASGGGGAGGSASNIRFFGGGGNGVTFFINAGDAGNATTGRTGAAGGSVTNIGGGAELSSSGDPNFSISPLTDFHHISAGNGGNSPGKGGVGGSVSNVFVNAAIGIRTGAVFGFNIAGVGGAVTTGAGGISAGAGGTGGTAAGLAGNVTNISADAIASIVAGHLDSGAGLQRSNFANEVSGIILNGAVTPSLVQQFQVDFDGFTSSPINTNATPIEVASALNAIIAPIQSANNVPLASQGVTVTSSPQGYIVTFNATGAEDALTGEEPAPLYTTEVVAGNFSGVQEVQNVQVFGINPFTLSFEGQTASTVLPANASAQAVQDALESIPGIGAGGISSVAFTPGTAGSNPSYTITFAGEGPEPLIVPNFVVGVSTAAGTVSTPQVVTLTLPTRGDINPTQFSTANFVGSIANILRPNATEYSVSTGPTTTFAIGQVPVDGLIAALDLTSYKNFVPEAFVTLDASGNAVLIDNLNS